MDALTEALEANRKAVADALPEAERELEACRTRCRELEASIAKARLFLDEPALEAPGRDLPIGKPMTMHGAMAEVLRSHPDGLPPVELNNEVYRRGLYRTQGGERASVGQVHARVGNYPGMFIRENGRIKLRLAADGPDPRNS